MVRKRNNPEGAPELTPLEIELMHVLWERGNATAAEVGEALGARRPLAATTIHTVLANLRRKGYVEPIPTVERSLRFAPRIGREQVADRSLRRLLGDFFGGSPGRLMAHLVNEEAVGPRDLEEIRKMLGSKPTGTGKKPEEKES